MKRWIALYAVLLASCANILDLEERKLNPDAAVAMPGGDGAVAPGATPSCAMYCKDAQELCTKEQAAQAFEVPKHCDAVCAKYPPGDPVNPVGNTLACRLNLLASAREHGEAATICQAAGPLGGASEGSGLSCGTNCESFCSLRQAVCPMETEPDCMRKCGGIPVAITAYNASVDFRSGTDSLQCRMAHLATAASYQADGDDPMRNLHCLHSGYKSTGPCDLKPTDLPSCADYCNIVNTACGADTLKVYESNDQCQKVCAKFSSAASDSATEDTLRCRRTNAYEALRLEPNARTCEAAGPAPLECGGSKCKPYCQFAKDACAAKFPFPSTAECETACNMIPDSRANQPFSVATATGDTLRCRLLAVMQAIAGDERSCDSALGIKGSKCNP